MHTINTTIFIIILLATSFWKDAFCMTANPIISRGKPAYTSSGSAAYLVDNKFDGTTFAVGKNTWMAIKTGTGFSKIFVSWNNTGYSWSDVIAATNSCKQNTLIPVNYTIQTSANSTNGNDGQWQTALTITANTVTTRGHVVDFTGASWIKISISSGGGSIDELEVFDLSAGGTDLWFFPGTSITANTYKATPPAQDYADLINQSFPAFNPAMIRGGIPCIKSSDLAGDISKYIAIAGNVKYWAIEMGTNDAWGGTNSGVSDFKKNMQTVIDACKTAGIQPIIARMIATNQSIATWQVHPDYLKAIDDLTTQNNLIAGPDLYTYFLAHPTELTTTDGVHPIATGAASIQRLWAQKMAPLYSATVTATDDQLESSQVSAFPNPFQENITISNKGQFNYAIYDMKGKMLAHGMGEDMAIVQLSLQPAMYVLELTIASGVTRMKIAKE